MGKRARFEILQKKASNMPHVLWAEESKKVSDLKSDLVMMMSQRRLNVQLPGNPAVS